MIVHARSFTAALLVALPLAACSREPEPVTPEGRTMVRVENRDFLDMNVYVVRSGQRIRLGTVTGLSTRLLAIPAALVGAGWELRFLVDPVGSTRTPISQAIHVSPGDVVELTIPPQR